MTTFETTRADGRTKTEVLLGVIGDAEPGVVFAYDTLRAALEDGGRPHDRHAVQAAIRHANKALLEKRQRCLRVVPGVGYRVIAAREHVDVADIRIRRGRRQVREALRTLANVRTSEMTEQERAVHAAQLSINAELFAQQERIRRDQTRMARLIAGITHRMDQKGI